MDTLKQLIKQFMPFAQERMGFEHPPRLFLRSDAQNASEMLGRTAQYNPTENTVVVYVTNRHPKDILRSLSHELVHHTQNGRGDFENGCGTEPGYAQNDTHMREMEREAYESGNLCFRDWEDSIKDTIYNEHLQKGDKKMSIKEWKNEEISTLLSEAWGFKFGLNDLNEGYPDVGSAETIEDDEAGTTGRLARGLKKEGEEAEIEEDAALEEGGAKKGEQSATRVDYPDAKDPDEDTGSGESAGDQSKTKGDYEKLKEDSGEDEAWHEWKNEHADDDHIREIEHHLRALKGDRDYERHGAEYDHDRYEDEGMEESAFVREISKRKDDPRNARAKDWPDRMRETINMVSKKYPNISEKRMHQLASAVYAMQGRKLK